MDYEPFDDLLPLRKLYREAKQNEKENSSASARESVLNDLSTEDRELFESIEKRIKEKTNATKEACKEAKSRAEELQTMMIATIQKILKDDNRPEIKESLPTGITFTRKRVMSLSKISDEEKEELLDYVIDNGWYEVLDINEKEYIKKDQELHPEGEEHLFGLEPQDDIKIVIRNK